MSITKFRLVNNLLEFSTTTYSTKVHTCCPGLLREMPPPFLLKIFLLKKFCFESIPPSLLGKKWLFLNWIWEFWVKNIDSCHQQCRSWGWLKQKKQQQNLNKCFHRPNSKISKKNIHSCGKQKSLKCTKSIQENSLMIQGYLQMH